MNGDGLVATGVATKMIFRNKKPASLFGKAGSKTGGMDGTRTRDLLRDRQTL